MKHLTQVELEEFSLWNIGVDLFLICLSLSSTSILITYSSAHRLGFFNGDNTLRYPFKSSTVSLTNLFCFGTIIPIITILILEVWLLRDESARRRKTLVAGRPVPSWIVRWLRQVLLFGYGLGCTDFVVNVAKFTVGRLRPHFLTVCQPNVLQNVTRLDPLAYITDYECTGANVAGIYQSRYSFPSGHSSLAFYAAVFVVMYVENRIRWPDRAIVVKTAFELAVVSLAVFTALSRISDYKHHWQDVLAGSILGASGAYFWVWRVLQLTPEYMANSLERI